MALKINPQKYNWPQKTCKLLKNKFPGSNWRVILMRSKQSEVFDKVSVTEICVFLTRRWTVTDFWLFVGLKKYFKKKSHHVSRLTLGYLWEEYEKFWFFIMCQIFSIWLGFRGHSLLIAFIWMVTQWQCTLNIIDSTTWKYYLIAFHLCSTLELNSRTKRLKLLCARQWRCLL